MDFALACGPECAAVPGATFFAKRHRLNKAKTEQLGGAEVPMVPEPAPPVPTGDQRQLPSVEHMFTQFAAPQTDGVPSLASAMSATAAAPARAPDSVVDVFGDAPLRAPPGNVDPAFKVMQGYSGRGEQFGLPQVRDHKDAVNAIVHQMAVEFFEPRHMTSLSQYVLQNASGKASLPVHTAVGADGARMDMFLFDEAFLRALFRFGELPAMPVLREVVLFTLYAMTMRRLFDQLTGVYYRIDAVRQGEGTINELVEDNTDAKGVTLDPPKFGKYVPILSYSSTAASKTTYKAKSQFTKELLHVAQGNWRWPQNTDRLYDTLGAFVNQFKGVKAGTAVTKDGEGKFVFDDPVMDDKADTAAAALQQRYADLLAANSAFVSAQRPSWCVNQLLAHVAYKSNAITALYNHFLWVATELTKVFDIYKDKTTGPQTANVDFIMTSATGPGKSGQRACGPDAVPVIEVSNAEAFEAIAGAEMGKKYGKDQRVPLKDATVNGKLAPGLSVVDCKPARDLSDVVQGAKMPALGGMVLPDGVALPVRPQSVLASFGGPVMAGGVQYGPFGANEVPSAAAGAPDTSMHSFSADTLQGVSFASPIVQRYFQAFNAPPNFRAVVITPPSGQPLSTAPQ